MSSDGRPVYLLIDPTVRQRGGITAYTDLAAPIINEAGFDVCRLKRNAGESPDAFRKRVANEAMKVGRRLAIIEAPETGAATLCLPPSSPVHIRLHCAHSLGTLWEGRTPSKDILDLEQKTLERAKWISAPSKAAWRETQRLFVLPKHINVFPNPAPIGSCTTTSATRRDGVLLLARAQTLKGVWLLPELLARLPKDLAFTIAGTGMPDLARTLDLDRRVTKIAEIEAGQVRRLMASAQVAIIPSLFETFSMVAVEALVNGTPVITWGHTGTAEIAAPPFVRPVSPWDIDAFAATIMDAINSPALPHNAYLSICEHLRIQYRQSIASIAIESGAALNSHPPAPLDLPKVPEFLLPNNNGQSATAMTPFRRKLRKLLRNPSAYIRDSKHLRRWQAVAAKLASNNRSGRSAPDIAPQNIANAQQNIPVKSTPATLHGLPLTAYPVAAIFDATQNRITFNDTKPADRGWSSLVFVPTAWKSRIGQLLHTMHETGNFYPFSNRNLAVVEVVGSFDTTAASIFAKLDTAGRNRLARYQNLVFLGNCGSLPQALRATHPALRVIQVADNAVAGFCDPLSTDMLITLGPAPNANGTWRRLMSAQNDTALAAAIGRALQEAGPKAYNLLLPVWGECPFDPTLLDVDTNECDGLIIIDGAPSAEVSARNFDQWLVAFAPKIRGVLLTETTLWRYRSLVDSATSQEDWATILGFCLRDGMRIDVRS